MRKFKAWLWIVLCSLLLILTVFTVVVIVESRYANPENTIPMTTKEIINSILYSIFFIIPLSVGLVYGVKKFKKIKRENTVLRIDYTGTIDINLSGKISYKDYRNLNLELVFKKPTYILSGCLVFILFVTNMIRGIELEWSMFFIIFLLFFFICYPAIVLMRVKRVYKTSRLFKEEVNYKLTDETIHITGETFESTQTWEGFYKMKETNNFFMFYQTVGIVTLLDKKMFTSEELANFKTFIYSLNLKQ